MTRRTLPLLFCLALVIGCSTAPAAPPYYGPSTPTPAELWSEFRAIHRDATPQMRRSAGRRLDDLLTDEARNWLTRPDSKMRAMLPPERRLPPDVARIDLLGDTIIARRDLIRRSKLASVEELSPTAATLLIDDGSTQTKRLPIAFRNGSWRFLPFLDLIGSYEDAMPLPSSPPSATPRTFASPDAVAQALVDAFNTEDGRLLHDVLDSSTRAPASTPSPKPPATAAATAASASFKSSPATPTPASAPAPPASALSSSSPPTAPPSPSTPPSTHPTPSPPSAKAPGGSTSAFSATSRSLSGRRLLDARAPPSSGWM